MGRFRRFRVIVVAAVGLCVIVAAALAGAALWYNSPDRRITRALDSLAGVDAQIARIDQVLNTPLSTETTAQVRAVQKQMPASQRSLSAARGALDALSTRDVATLARLSRVRRSIAARRDLLNSAAPLLTATSQAATALAQASEGWRAIQTAADLSASASQEFAHQTQDAMVSSHELSTQAADAYAQAHTSFSAAQKTLPEADFAGYLAWLQQRILMTKSSLLASENWINGRYQDANDDVSAYNGFAQAAARIAGAGLQLPSDVIADWYQKQTAAAQADYDQAREEVLQADAALR